MEDTSFIDLLREENLSRINIDPRLIDAFKNVMKNIQLYFNEKGYSSEREYAKLFNDYILTQDTAKKMSFVVSDEPSKYQASGFYDTSQNRICIDTQYINSQELEGIFCHEFIHFLVAHDMRNTLDKTKNSSIYNGGFINEALTEMLTEEIYSEKKSYEPQVSMLNFANILNNQVNNYSVFLSGGIDSSKIGASWMNFTLEVEKYHDKWQNLYYSMADVINDEEYIAAQRHLIKSNIHPHLVFTIDQYEEIIKKLLSRPVEDKEFIDKFIQEIKLNFIRKLKIKNRDINEMFTVYLSEYREIIEILSNEKNFQPIASLKINKHKIQISKDGRVYVDRKFLKQNTTSNFVITIDGKQYSIDMNKINFNAIELKNENIKQNLIARKSKIETLFNNIREFNTIIPTITDEGLIKVIRYDLPNINMKESNESVYIAVYRDRIELLNSLKEIGLVQDIKLSRYDGRTYPYDTSGAIASTPLFNMEQAYLYSILDESNIERESKKILYKSLITTLTEPEKQKIIDEYRKSDEYEENSNLGSKELEEYAIIYYRDKKYQLLSFEEKEKLRNQVISNNVKILISSNNGEIFVSELLGNNTGLLGNSEVIFDKQGLGKYNQIASDFKKRVGEKVNNSNYIQIPINVVGNLIFEQSQNSINQQTIPKVSEERIKVFKEKIGFDNPEQIAKKINDLVEQFRIECEYSKDNESFYKYIVPSLKKTYRRRLDPNFMKENIEQLVETSDNWLGDIVDLKNYYNYDLLNDEERRIFDEIIRDRRLNLLEELKKREKEIEQIRDNTERLTNESEVIEHRRKF